MSALTMSALTSRPISRRSLWTPILLVLLAWPGLLSTPASGVVEDPDPVGVWPLDPAPDVVEPFDPPDEAWGSGHRGVDLTGGMGQPVRTAMSGTVAFVGIIAGKPVVTVLHDGAAPGTRTTYEPVAAAVKTGDRVAAGEVIGRLVVPGSHCFPASCLHWGWLRGETYLDPLRLVGAEPIRLLPLWRDEPLDSLSSAPWMPLRSAQRLVE